MVQVSRSGVEPHLLRAGHPPAVKAGGKRVAIKKSWDDNPHVNPEKDSKKPDKPRSLATSNRNQQVSVLMAGTLEKLGHDFPETPVSVRHSRLRPAMEKPHVPKTFCIQQPRKLC